MLLQLVDHLFATGEGGFAVVTADGDDDGDIADGQATDAVVKGDGVETVFRLCLFGDAGHFPDGHRGVALKIEVGDGFALIVVADGADEEDDAATGGVLDGGVSGVDAELFV